MSDLENVGIKGTALDWFNSYLKDVSFSIPIGNLCSSLAKLFCGVLPLLVRKYNIMYHLYADETQLYIRQI